MCTVKLTYYQLRKLYPTSSSLEPLLSSVFFSFFISASNSCVLLSSSNLLCILFSSYLVDIMRSFLSSLDFATALLITSLAVTVITMPSSKSADHWVTSSSILSFSITCCWTLYFNSRISSIFSSNFYKCFFITCSSFLPKILSLSFSASFKNFNLCSLSLTFLLNPQFLCTIYHSM